MKIWSGINVPELLSYSVVWSDSKIDEDWERKLKERERIEYGEREKEENGGYLQLQKISSSKMNIPRKRLGYDARISSSISQVESRDMRSHNTFTMGILLPRSCLTCESKILIDFTSNDRFSFTWIESNSRMWLGSGTYFLSWDTWKILWMLTKGLGKFDKVLWT